jgi:hypothetical protein
MVGNGMSELRPETAMFIQGQQTAIWIIWWPREARRSFSTVLASQITPPRLRLPHDPDRAFHGYHFADVLALPQQQLRFLNSTARGSRRGFTGFASDAAPVP